MYRKRIVESIEKSTVLILIHSIHKHRDLYAKIDINIIYTYVRACVCKSYDDCDFTEVTEVIRIYCLARNSGALSRSIKLSSARYLLDPLARKFVHPRSVLSFFFFFPFIRFCLFFFFFFTYIVKLPNRIESKGSNRSRCFEINIQCQLFIFRF